MIPGSANPLLMAAAQDTGYNVSRSLRFNAPDSAYLSRTPGSAGNRKTWTFSCWVKRGRASTGTEWFYIFDANSTTGSGENYIRINGNHAGHTLSFYSDALGAGITTSQVFRDHSAWFHLVAVLDTTQATASDRMQLYINGSRVTAFSSATYPTQNADGGVNNGTAHTIGSKVGGDRFFDGYLAECHLIDGTALTPSSFGETNATTGQWVPKAFSGSYGTNGFRLDFSDNSGVTATTLGKDRAGSNNWTPNNFSVTAGAGNDSLVDTPTSYGTDTGAGGEVRGNYATWNPLALGAAGSITNGNLDLVINPPSTAEGRIGNFYFPSGKWYWEMTVTVVSSEYPHVGLTPRNNLTGVNIDSNGDGYCIRMTGKIDALASTNQTYGTSYASNDIVMFAYDVDAGKLWYGKNGTWQVSGNPATGANPSSSGISTTTSYTFAASGFGSPAAILNGGQRPFAYTAPSGFKALCDTNLPTPTIVRPSTVLQATLWSGNSTNNRSISGLEFSPDFVWIKNRSSSAGWNVLFDVVRGAGNQLATNQTDAELATGSNLAGKVGSFDSSGFTLVAGSGSSPYKSVNETDSAYVGWAWDAGSSTVTNTQGSITSSVRANASAGFSIVTYTGNGSAGATVGHGLGVTPGLVILKSRSLADSDWVVTHSAFANQTDNFLRLNTTGAVGTLSGVWSKTSTTFGFPTSYDGTNKNGSTYVAYCFAPVAGYSSFGSYTGNGSADGPFVFCNFRPRWLLIKNASSSYDGGGTTVNSASWYLYDAARGTYNGNGNVLAPNKSYSEENNLTDVDFLSNGFKIRNNRNINGDTNTMVYACFAESPFQYARAR